MRFGYCLGLNFLNGDFEVFNAVSEAGFDYVELPLSALSALQPREFAELEKALSAIPCKACNLFFPREITLVGPGMDVPGITAYLERMLPVAASLGIETLVFGNGGARKIPDGATRDSVWANLRTIAELMEEHAGKAGVTIAVEPLNTTETDIINSYGEAVELTTGLTHVAAMVDSYHVAMEKQNFDDMLKAPEKLAHLHTAFPIGRYVPSPADDMTQYADFVSAVKQAGYNGKLSIEGGLRSSEGNRRKEIADALAVLQKMFYSHMN